MAKQKKMFSDSWHLVADKHACLLPKVEVFRQFYRGEQCYVLKDPFKNDFFRISEPAWHFVARLRMDKTIENVWRDCLDINPDEAPGQEEVVELLGQLGTANLVQTDLAANSDELFKAYQKRRRKQTGMQLMNFLFFKIPIFNPDHLLEFFKPLGKLIFNRWAGMLWLLVVGSALKIVIENLDSLTKQTEGLLSPNNLAWILICSIGLKAVHEFAHGLSCKQQGGEVNTFGIMLMVFAPLPYVDATASWAFPNRFHRLLVSFAGMLAELFVAAIAVFVWYKTGRGTVNAIAYNTIIVGSVTTLLFNMNPLLKFDGYYILVDILGIPNLQQRSFQYIKYLTETYAFGHPESLTPVRTSGEPFWFVVYGFSSAIYRFFLMSSISFLVATRFFEIGLVLAGMTLFMYIIVPAGKFLRYLFTNKAIARQRKRAIAVTVAVLTAVFIGIGIIPLPEYFSESGLVWAETRSNVHTASAGRVIQTFQQSGQWVHPGDPLLMLQNNELDFEISMADLRIRQAEERYRLSQNESLAAVAPLLKMLEFEKQKKNRLLEEKDNLIVRAPIEGLWISPGIDDLNGQWLTRGSTVGRISDNRRFQFIAVISQQEAANLFDRDIKIAEIRLWGKADEVIPAEVLSITQAEQNILPSPALGWLGGGTIEVDKSDEKGLKTIEPFFQIKARIIDPSANQLFDERTGRIRFRTGSRPLFFQWMHDLRQLIQKRLKL